MPAAAAAILPRAFSSLAGSTSARPTRPESMKLLVSAGTLARGVKVTLSVERKMSKRVSLSELSRQVKRISVEDSADAARLLGAGTAALLATVLVNGETPAPLVARIR